MDFVQSDEADFAIERHGSCSVEEQHDGEGGEGEDVVVDSEALVDSDSREGYQHVDCDEERGEASEQSEDEEYAACKFGVGGDVSEPVGQPEGGDVVSIVMQGAEGQDLLVSMDGHGYAEDETHEKRAGGLQAVEPFRHKNPFCKRVSRRGVRMRWFLAGGCRGRYELGAGCGR
jgi:hypothetical protein